MKESILKNFYNHEVQYVPVGGKIDEEVLLRKMNSTAKMFGHSLSSDNIASLREWIRQDNLNRFGGEKIKENDIVDVVTETPSDIDFNTTVVETEAGQSAKTLRDITDMAGQGLSINDICAVAASYGYGQAVARSKQIFGDYVAPEDITKDVYSREVKTSDDEIPEFNINDWNDDEAFHQIVNPDGTPLNVDLDNPTPTEKAVMRWADKNNVTPTTIDIDGRKYLKFSNGYYVLIGTSEVRSAIVGLFKPFVDGYFGSMIKKNPKIVDDPVFKVLNKTANAFLGAMAGK